MRLCDTHYRHTWPPTHSPWHHNYQDSSIFIFPKHGAAWHTCGHHLQGADTVLMSLLIVRSVSGLITSVMTFQPMRNCFARHLSMLQNRNIFFIIFFNLASGPLCPTLNIAFCLNRSVILSFKPFLVNATILRTDSFILLASENSSVSTKSICVIVGVTILWCYFDILIRYHNQEFSDTMTQGWLYRLGDDGGPGTIREKWFIQFFPLR